MNLITKAKSFKSLRKYEVKKEELALAVAYLQGEVTDKQAGYALGYQSKYPLPVKQKLMTVLKHAVLQKKLVVKIK